MPASELSTSSNARLSKDSPRAQLFRGGGGRRKEKMLESLSCDHIMTLYTN